jgi:hypothetical protein
MEEKGHVFLSHYFSKFALAPATTAVPVALEFVGEAIIAGDVIASP